MKTPINAPGSFPDVRNVETGRPASEIASTGTPTAVPGIWRPSGGEHWAAFGLIVAVFALAMIEETWKGDR